LTNSDPKDQQRAQERRKTARFPFVANCEVSEANSDARIKARVSEISLYGCYVDMLNPPPVGARVFIKIFTEADFLETSASVVYSHPNLGIGVTFRELGLHFMPVLQKWLLEAVRSSGRDEKA
jgi:hypothetical protein